MHLLTIVRVPWENPSSVVSFSASKTSIPGTTQVVRSGARIPPEPAGNGIFSGLFPPVPVHFRPETAGKTTGTWKQYSGRNYPYPEPRYSGHFREPEISWKCVGSSRNLPELWQVPPGSNRKKQYSDKEATENSRNRPSSDHIF